MLVRMLTNNQEAKYDLKKEAFRETDRSVAAGTQIAVGDQPCFIHFTMMWLTTRLAASVIRESAKTSVPLLH